MATHNIFLSPDELIKSDNLFPVVGIGASAGGLEAFTILIEAIPPDSGMAYVLVQHLDPSHESMLPHLLQRTTPIPVVEITDDITVRPNHIYIIPSNRMLIATDGVLKLSPRLPKSDRQLHLPINLFFSSLAEIHQSHAIGVVLSGTATDGTEGLRAIKENGGMTFAQDEESAAYDGMPSSAINAGVVDFILPPDAIPQRIAEMQLLKTNGKATPRAQTEEQHYNRILHLLRVRNGTDFTYYKKPTIKRRIARRMGIAKIDTTERYYQFLASNVAEQTALYSDLLIPVTGFFRDKKIFQHLCEVVFPDMVQNKARGEQVRAWLAGCSTGQEAYSIAICLREICGNSGMNIQIFATDISEAAITKARSGIYTAAELQGVSPYRLQEFFVKSGNNYHVSKSIRDMCVFATHNFIKDPPFGKMDFISCRNVLIYMEPYLQKKALSIFHYALNPKGILLMGKSETNAIADDLFTPVDKVFKLYARKDVPGRFMHIATSRNEQFLSDKTAEAGKENDFRKNANDIMLRWFMPSSVIVNEFMDIVEYRGVTHHYLVQTPGKPSHNVLKLARKELAYDLRSAMARAKKDNKAIIRKDILLVVEGENKVLSLEVIPLPNMADPHYLILFRESTAAVQNVRLSVAEKKDRNSNHVTQLENELETIREEMRTVTEDHESANEFLQRVNEELLSGSEELQSLNEELETSKEELQSSNEELIVMNQQMAALNEDSNAAKDYAEAIIATIREPLIVLDKDLLVKSANNAFYKTFRLTKEDSEGKSIYELGDAEWTNSLKTLFKVLPIDRKLINFEVIYNIPGFGERSMLLNAREITKHNNDDTLILLVIEDITQRIELQNNKTQLLQRFHDLVVQAPVAVCILKGKEHIVEIANKAYLELIGKSNSIIGKPLFKSLPILLNQGIKELLDHVMKTGERYHGNEIGLTFNSNDLGAQTYYNFVYQPMYESGPEVTGIIVVVTEITEQVKARKIMEEQAAMVQELLMTAPGFVCMLEGPKHVYGLINQRYQQLFGGREIRNKPIMKALPELKGQGVAEKLSKVYKSGVPYVGIDEPMSLARDIGLEPELRYFNFSYQPMYNVNRKIYAILVFGYEVTDQVNAHHKIVELKEIHNSELEEKVQLRTKELQASNLELTKNISEIGKKNKELESFNYISSHDLQEPLRKIQLFAGRIIDIEDEACLSAEAKSHFLRIQAAAWRMQTLLEDLLSYSRAGIAERLFEQTDLKTVVEEVLDELAENIIETDAEIIVGELCYADINASQFRQVMNNIIGNSLKYYQKDKRPHITISSRTIDGSTQPDLDANIKYCHISIEDRGIGFKSKYCEKIFEVFQRLHAKGDYEGTGIGLAIVKKIVEGHDGVIRASSVPNQKTTFDIFIPNKHQIQTAGDEIPVEGGIL